MDKYGFKKLIIFSAIAGLIIGILQAVFDINLLTDHTVLYVVIIVIAVAAASIVISFNQWKRPMVLANEGKFKEAIQAFEKLHEKHKGKMGYRDQALSGIANMYNRMGEFEKSNSCIEKLNFDRLDNNSKAVNYAIYAYNLYFLNTDLYKARGYIKNSREILELPESILLHALLQLELEGQDSSDNIIKQYESLKFNKKVIGGFYTVLLIDELFKRVSENFMIGLYYYKIGEEDKAKAYLLEASNCSYESFFSDTAKHLLKEL